MEEQCPKSVKLTTTTVVLSSLQPSTSRRSSMSMLQEDFTNAQHDFTETLDEETTTSGVLETFEISSSNSNSLPISSDAPAEDDIEVVVDDSSSTHIIKLIEVSQPESCHNEFFNSSEVYVINDDDDEEDVEDDHDGDDEGDINKKADEIEVVDEPFALAVDRKLLSQSIDNNTGDVVDESDGNVIMCRNVATIYIETPVVEEQPHHSQIRNIIGGVPMAFPEGSNVKPKRLSDEFLLVENAETVDDEFNALSTDASIVTDVTPEEVSQPDKVSFRLKQMQINNGAVLELAALHDVPTGSQALPVATADDIESTDLIERRDFKTEQRLSGSRLLTSGTMINKNMLSLSLFDACRQQYQAQKDADTSTASECSKRGSGVRAVSSDSKCFYKDPTTTPTSSRISSSRLSKSTTKVNLCSALSQPSTNTNTNAMQSNDGGFAKWQLRASKIVSSIAATPSSSVIVEPPLTTESGSSVEYPPANDNEACGGSGSAEGGCSRTSAIHGTLEGGACSTSVFDDTQPSTSSARCQYALPSKSTRQVHASAQTYERYLPRGESFSGSSASSDSGINLSTVNRTRRRTESLNSQLMRNVNTANNNSNNHNDDIIVAFKVVAEAAAAAGIVEFNEDPWADCEENNSDVEEICTCQHGSDGHSFGGSNTSLNDGDDLDTSGVASVVASNRDGELSNYIQMVSISEEATSTAAPVTSEYSGTSQLRKRKFNDGCLLDGDCGNVTLNINGSGGGGASLCSDTNSRKRIAYDYASTPRTMQSTLLASTPAGTQLVLSAGGSPIGRRTPRSLIPTRDNPPPELYNWLMQFQRWSHAERLLAIDRMIEHCEPTQVRHMMKVIEPQFQRDFISLLPRELALQVLAYLAPGDLLRAAQTCRSWRFLCDDNLLWKEKCRKAQILTEPSSDRPKRGRAGNMPPIASPWKAAYMRQHIIEMNWRSRPIRDPKMLKGHDDHVITCLQFAGNRIVSGSDDNTLKVWSAVTGRCLRTLVGHTGGVWSSQMSGNIIISGSTDRTLKVWDMETGHCVHTLQGHTSTVRCMHLHGNKVVSGSRDATLRVWDIEQGTCLHVLVGHLAAVRCVQYDGKLIVSGAYDYMVKIWHPERQECLHTLQGHTNRVYSLQFDGVHVVSGSLDTSIRVWDAETGNCKHTLMGHQSLTSGMELRQNILVSGNADSTVKVWDITTGQCLQTLSGPNKHQSAVTCLQFNSRFVVTSSDDGTVKLWDVKTGDFIRNLVGLESGGSGGVVWRIRANDTKLICAVGSRNGTEETKLMVLDFDVEGACVKCS